MYLPLRKVTDTPFHIQCWSDVFDIVPTLSNEVEQIRHHVGLLLGHRLRGWPNIDLMCHAGWEDTNDSLVAGGQCEALQSGRSIHLFNADLNSYFSYSDVEICH